MTNKLFNFGQSIVKWIAVVFLGYLTITAASTYIYDSEWMEIYVDSRNILQNILGVIAFVGIYGLLVWLRTKFPLTTRKWNRIYALILLAIFVLTIIEMPMPRADLANMLKAIFEFNEGDTSYLNDGYFKVWPQMLPMVALFMPFGTIPFVFYIFNFILLLIAFSFIMQVTNSNKWIASAIVLCFPVLQYTCVYYGEFIAIFSIIMSVCYMTKIISGTTKKGDYIGLFVVSFFGYCFKQNFIIFIAAEVLTIVLFLFKEKNKKLFVSMALILFATALVSPFQHIYTKAMIGKEYESQNNLTWIAMGMHEKGERYWGAQINGGYDGFNSDVVRENDFDKEGIHNDSIQDIKKSIQRFKDNGFTYTLNFYHDKLSKQWTTPDWSIAHYVRNCRANNVMELTEAQLSYGKDWHPSYFDYAKFITPYDQTIDVFNKGMIIVVYASVLFWLFNKKTGTFTFVEIMLLALFIGNFLFSIIWEAKPRYNIYGYFGLVLLYGYNARQPTKNMLYLIRKKVLLSKH